MNTVQLLGLLVGRVLLALHLEILGGMLYVVINGLGRMSVERV